MMRREDGSFAPVTWDAALDVVARKLADIKRESGPDAIVIFSTARSTNEENYVTQKFARAVLGTNNVDHCARLCHAPTTVGPDDDARHGGDDQHDRRTQPTFGRHLHLRLEYGGVPPA